MLSRIRDIPIVVIEKTMERNSSLTEATYVVDESGNYIIDESGNRIISE